MGTLATPPGNTSNFVTKPNGGLVRIIRHNSISQQL